MDTPLLTTKLHIPQPRPNLVARRRLTERIDEGLRQGMHLTLISAPAGFGKTTLLSEWIHSSKPPMRAAWVSLDESDNDPVSFWSHLIAALQTIPWDEEGATLGEGVLVALQSPTSAQASPFAASSPATETAPPIHALLTSLLNEIAELPTAFALILDDYHVIEAQPIHRALMFLLDHAPPQMHLVLTSRVDPPLPLGRLRGRYQLAEVREADLRFTHEETTAFLNEAMGLGLSEGNLAALEASTEGWAVGLQLAAISLKGKEAVQVESFIQDFGGSHRHVIDYLVEEVLQQQSDEIRDFLFQTAILERMNAPLCDALTGRDDSQSILEALERANLFLVPLDEHRGWYRYHHLFADCLRALAKMQPSRLAALHQRAAGWYKTNGFGAEAIKHALAAGDTADASRLIALAAEDTLRHARFVTFCSWLDALPEELVRTDYDLSTTLGWALMLKGDWPAAESCAKAAAKILPADAPQSMQAKVVSLQAVLDLLRGGPLNEWVCATQQAMEALELIGDTNPLFRGMLLSILGESQRLHGNLEAAVRILRESVALNQRIGNHIMAIIAISNLALLLHQRGRRREAAALCQETIARYTDRRGRPIPAAGVAYVLLAIMHYEANDLAQARQYVHKGLELNQHMTLFTPNLMGRTLLAQLQQAMGETQAGLATLQETCQEITEENARRWTTLAARAVEANLLLKQGNLAAVAHRAEESNLSPGDAPSYIQMPIYLAYARLLLAQSRPEEARILLAKLERTARDCDLDGILVAIHALQALTQQALGRTDQALSYLRKALHLAAPEDYYRSLLDEGQPLASLLFSMRARLGEAVVPSFVHNLVEAFQTELEYAPSQAPLLVEPLTERELEVLRLIVAGLSNQEIASQLVLAMGTIKKHITNIYGKLGVRRRAQAIARARELDLL